MSASVCPGSMDIPTEARCDRGIIPQPMLRNSSDEQTIRAAVRAYAKHYGTKQGLALAAEAIGMGERACRHALEGTYFAADAERARCADEARLRLVETQLRELRTVVADVEQRNAKREDAAGARDDRAGRVGGLWRALVAAVAPTSAGRGVKAQ